MRKQPTTIIEITQSHIKIFEGALNRLQPEVRQYRCEKIVDASEQGVGTLLSSMMDKRLKKSFIVAIAPRRQVMFRVFFLPSHQEPELKKMIYLQVLRQVPYPKDDIVFDYDLLEKDPSGYTKVLVAIVRKEIINQYFKIFLEAGISVNAITLSSAGITKGIFSYQKKQPVDFAFVVLHMDFSSSEICFCQKNKLLFSRYVHFGTRDVQAGQEHFFVKEVEMTFQTYQKQKMGDLPTKMFFLGPEESLVGLSCNIENHFKISTEIIEPFRLFFDFKDLVIPKDQKENYCSPVVPFGCFLPSEQKSFNLLPKEIAEKRTSREKKNALWRFLILLSAMFCLGAAIFFVRLQKQRDYFYQVEQSMRQLNPRVDEIHRKQEQIEIIEAALNLKPLVVDIVHEITRLTPADIFFRLIQVNQQGQVSLQGVADQLSSVNAFQNQLVNSSMFADVSLQYATQRRAFEGEITDFRITAKIVRSSF